MLKKAMYVFLVICMLSMSAVFPFISVVNAADSNRYSIDLSGTWNFTPSGMGQTTINVPDCWDRFDSWKSVTSATFERSVSIPSTWSGKKIMIACPAINSKADVYVNSVLVGSVTGYKMPFSFDATSSITTFPSTADVKIVVTAKTPLLNSSGLALYSNGWYGINHRYGLLEPVTLTAVPKVYVSDAFVRTSTRNGNIAIDFTVTNNDTVSHTVVLSNQVLHNGTAAFTLNDSSAFAVGAGQSVTQTVTQAWTTATYWTPDNPYLYDLTTTLKESGTALDVKTTRFGFREVWVDNTTTPGRLYLNGVQFNMRGDTDALDEQFNFNDLHTWMPDKNGAVNVITQMKKLNMNVMRMHMSENPQYLMDAADEQGMLLIDEFMYGSIGGLSNQDPILLANQESYAGQHILLDRNHPSIIMYNASNEVVGYGTNGFGALSLSQMLSYISYMQTIDSTRPVNCDGENSSPAVDNLHYTPGGYQNDWPVNNDVYGYISKPNTTKMWAMGEFLGNYLINSGHSYRETMAMQGLYSRAARYYGYADIRPYRLDWSWEGLPDRQLQADTVAKSFAPIAVFDHGYDGMGVNPILLATGYPSYATSANISRTLDVYNDALSDTSVTLKWYANFNGTTIASGTPVLTVPLGQHVSQGISFTAPSTNGRLELVMQSWKGGVMQFNDTRYFTIGTGTDNIAPKQIQDLSASYPTEGSAVLKWTAPGNDNDKGTASSYDIRYSTAAITDANWASATQVSGESAPDLAFTPQEMEITGLNPNTVYYFAMKTSDGINTSLLSNVASATTMASSSTTALISIADKSSKGDASSQSNGDIYVMPNLFTNGIAEDTINNSFGYVKFDVSGFSSTSRALLKLYQNQNTNPGAWNLIVYGLDNTSWDDTSSLTSPIPGVNKGVGITNGDSGATYLTMTNVTPATVGKYITVDVTSFVTAKKLQGATQVAFLLYGQPFESETLGSTFSGHEKSGQQPKLVVNGTVVVPPPSNQYEAENAVLSGGAVVATDHTGYSGTGFVEGFYNSSTAQVLFNVNAQTAGSYNIDLRYSAGNGTNTNTGLYVNGTKIKDITCNTTTNWNTWADETETVTLNAGNNTIAYKPDAASTANINPDYITVNAASSVLEAENAALSGGAAVATDHTGYSGTGFVDGYFNVAGADTKFTVNASSAGNKTVTLRYSAGGGTSTNVGLYVNGTKIKDITCPGTADWNTWGNEVETVSLNSGSNTIEYKSDSSSSSCINLDNITIQ